MLLKEAQKSQTFTFIFHLYGDRNLPIKIEQAIHYEGYILHVIIEKPCNV